jgi:CheY-like chemotaxis protein
VLNNKLLALGHQVTVAGSVREAQEIFERDGFGAFDCLITDCCMAEQSGLDLLVWLKDQDPTLASIIMSRDANEELLTRLLRCGASDFLEKPVMSENLKSSLARTLESTQRRRRHAATNSAVIEAGLVQRRMNDPSKTTDFDTPLTVCYHPRHQAGGDSVSFFPQPDGRMLIVVADVSGHDLKSAFISAYFQGMLRGLVEEGTSTRLIFERFNRFLVGGWNSPPGQAPDGLSEIISLSACAIAIDPASRSMHVLNSGFPIIHRLRESGEPMPCGDVGGNPLGWFDPAEITDLSFPIDKGDRLIVWTDGLEDFAHQLGVSEWSLAFRLLAARESDQDPVWLRKAPDDLLVIVARVSESIPEVERFPLLRAEYPVAEKFEVDLVQARWAQTLSFAIPDVSSDRATDALLCCREAVLRALASDGPRTGGRCIVQFTVDASVQELEICVISPGIAFRPPAVDPDHLSDEERGLFIVHQIPTRVSLSDCGSAIHMHFSLSPQIDLLRP